ncbi:hypothetical protein [Streptomyces sp. 3214.6]|uniref:hypothetical protein n=1 Tax=Streptomyces sp. 3214.6 TaxID=1882757 RepID=UPI00090B2B78|nr:hypothetical protein [Streptomyces sp. 3214.6]SHI25846.1 hypothetical protein SAMN05444521_6335 [Streptomyces sp. 3214.6]
MPDTTPNVTPDPGTGRGTGVGTGVGTGAGNGRRPDDPMRPPAPAPTPAPTPPPPPPPAGTVAPGGTVPPGEGVLPDGPGGPAEGEPRGRTTAGSRAPLASGTAAATPAATATAPPADAQGAHLLPEDECDRIASRMRHAVVRFVDGPRDAVEEADQVLEELAARLTDAVDRRRRTLRGSWQESAKGKGDGGKDRAATAATSAPTVDTEQLRLALRDYRALTERLLHL